jgi:2-polyprenyl-6-methoxyphenol hydroxylase-like FAD-dependent oxidoreductase
MLAAESGTPGVGMPRVVVLGGGIVGLSTGMLLAERGCDVTVVERDPTQVPDKPDDAWQDWDRPGVAQFRQPHYLHPAGSQLFATLLPSVHTSLAAAQARRFDVLGLMPPFITDRSPRDGDEKFVTLTGRRPVIEYAVASAAADRLDIRRGTHAAGLLDGAQAAPGVPHVTGVRLADGSELEADLVIDAMGRRSPLPGWLNDIGAREPAGEAEDSGFIYYTRNFRPKDGAGPPPFLTGLNVPFECFSLLTLPGDADTWSVTVYLSTHDPDLKEIRHPDNWQAVVAGCPLHAHLLDGVPITDVIAMGGVLDRYRRYVRDGSPVATGVLPVGDAMACTNPSLGRGMTLGAMHAAGTADVVGEHLGDPLALALAHDEMTQARIMPWYENTVALDRARLAQLDAAAGRATAPPAGGPGAHLIRDLTVAMLYDADLFRAFVEFTGMLALPQEVLARPGLADRIAAVAAEHEELVIPGPTRADVLGILS